MTSTTKRTYHGDGKTLNAAWYIINRIHSENKLRLACADNDEYLLGRMIQESDPFQTINQQ